MPSHPLDLDFPPLPGTVMELQKLSTSGSVDTQQLAEIVKKDPTVAMRVLRRANSSYWGVRREVSDVDHAVRLLGFRAVREMGMVEGLRLVRDSIAKGRGQEVFNRLMYLSSYTAYFGQLLTSALGLEEASGRTFSAGLLHTAGRLGLLYTKPKEYVRMSIDLPAPVPDASREKEVFGTDHHRVAEEACRHWDLPAGLTRLVTHYHRPRELEEERERTLAAIVAAGSNLAVQDMSGKEKKTYPQVLAWVERDHALVGKPVKQAAGEALLRAKEAASM